MTLESFAEWLLLPEIECPALQNPSQSGKVYNVHKIGFLSLQPRESADIDGPISAFDGRRYLLPTAEIDLDAGKQLCRLPLELGEWARHTVGLVGETRVNVFPTRVEFGVLQGRHYAEML